MSEALTAETISMTGHGGDEIEAYLARPHGAGPFGGVWDGVVAAWDGQTNVRMRICSFLQRPP